MTGRWTGSEADQERYRQLYPTHTHAQLGQIFRPDIRDPQRRKWWSTNTARKLRCCKSASARERESVSCSTPSAPESCTPVTSSSAAYTPPPRWGEDLPKPHEDSQLKPPHGRRVGVPCQVRPFPEEALSGRTLRFGLTSDQHLGSYYERLDLLEKAYDTFAEREIQVVLNCGNWIDGERRCLLHEIHTVGLDRQLQYAVDKWPSHPGIHTYFVAGDDHEGWYQQDVGIEIGERFEDVATRSGRTDLHYLGYVEADLTLPGSESERWVRVMHPGGGSSKSISLTPQNIIDSFEEDDRPELLLIGHYHKSEFLPHYRGTAIIQAGCMQNQSVFCRKQKIKPHLGFWIVELELTPDGRIVRILPEWFAGAALCGPKTRRFHAAGELEAV